MNVIVNERQLRLLKESFVLPPDAKERIKTVKQEKEQLEDYIEKSGEYMIDITNGKTYLVQYLKALSSLVGKPYAMCAPVRSDGTYGAFYVKPYDTFQKKLQQAIHSQGNSPIRHKPNLYQTMGLGEN